LPANKIYIIGIGYKPLDKSAIDIICRSEVILASKRLYEVFKRYEDFEAIKGKVAVINNVDETINFISSEVRKFGSSEAKDIVLLASGDPMFFGIGRRAIREFGKDSVEILPDLSSVQVAFSRIKEPWDDALLISLHGGPDPAKRRRLPYELSDIPALLATHNKLAVLTDKENNPAVIANILVKSSELNMFVCERLGHHDERVTSGSPEEVAGMSFSDPNVVIIINTATSSHKSPTGGELKAPALAEAAVSFGLTESEIQHSKGLITKDEVRAIAIHKLKLPLKGVFWDIGAGSGSISIEAAKLCPGLKVFAVEKDKEQIDNIRENRMRFNALNIEVINGPAPDILKGLPGPDRVFIGGSGGMIDSIIDYISKTAAGIIVINATTIETLNRAVDCLKKTGFNADISQVSVSRTKSIGDSNYLSALNPVFIIKGERR